MGLFKSKSRKTKLSSQQRSHASSSDEQPRRESSAAQPETYTTHHCILSFSNLSTTSTLTDARTGSRASRPAQPAHMTSYEAFLYQAQIDAERSEARLKAQQHAWRVAEQRRVGNMWPREPWRAGFAMPASTGWSGNGAGGQGVEGWLKQNGMRK